MSQADYVYDDHDLSMSQTSMVASIDDVEEVNWQNQQPAVQTDLHSQVDTDSETADSFNILSTDGRGETLEGLNGSCLRISTADEEGVCWTECCPDPIARAADMTWYPEPAHYATQQHATTALEPAPADAVGGTRVLSANSRDMDLSTHVTEDGFKNGPAFGGAMMESPLVLTVTCSAQRTEQPPTYLPKLSAHTSRWFVMAVARVCDYDCALANMRPASDSCPESPQSDMHTAEPDPSVTPMPSVSSMNLLSDGTLCGFGDCSGCCREFGCDCITFDTPDGSGFESIAPQHITLDELTRVSSEPAEVDISAGLISTLPAEVGVSAKLNWSLPANLPAAEADITTDACEHVLTNHTTEFTAASEFCLGDEADSKLQQTKYGYRGDAHIGEASHAGPENISLIDDKPDVEAGWSCNVCTSLNHELLRSCEMCGRVKRPRRTETGVGDAARTHKQIQNAENLFEAIAASCT